MDTTVVAGTDTGANGTGAGSCTHLDLNMVPVSSDVVKDAEAQEDVGSTGGGDERDAGTGGDAES